MDPIRRKRDVGAAVQNFRQRPYISWIWLKDEPRHATGSCQDTNKRRINAQLFPIAFDHPHISMDGKGAWRDNVFVERLWRSVKYEEVYLHAYASVPEARASLGRYLTFYNSRRPHSSLDRRTPDQAYFNRPLLAAA